jgi:ubiquinone/menaquinone biosynthesis C-methylase UbiE
MDARLQRRIQRYGWDKAAPHYERYWQDQLAPSRERLLALAGLAPGERVLDAACGTGLVTFPAAEAVGPSGSVAATDISEAMVGHVAREAAGRGMAHVASSRMDAEDLQFDDSGFDVVLCALGLMYVPDPLAALRESIRVLRPGGRMIAAVWGARNRCGWAEIFPIVDARVQSEVCPMFFQLGTGDRLTLTLAEAGFEKVSAERISAVLKYATAEDACGAAFAGGPVALAYSRFDDEMRGDAHAEYLASIEPYRRAGGYEIPGEFVVARGYKPGGTG